MKFLKKISLKKKVRNYIYEPKQINDEFIYLTVKNIYIVEEPGSIDFGGSEYAPAKILALSPEKIDKNDKYGWWRLKPGNYLIEFNEEILPENGLYVKIFPAHFLLRNNAYHPEIFFPLKEEFLKEYKYIPLLVGEPGISIKQNARVSCLFIIHFKSEFFPPS